MVYKVLSKKYKKCAGRCYTKSLVKDIQKCNCKIEGSDCLLHGDPRLKQIGRKVFTRPYNMEPSIKEV